MTLKKKVCMLGSFAVGKTSLVRQFIRKKYFEENYYSTVGATVDEKKVEVDGQEVLLLVWDMAGEETLNDRHEKNLRGASGYLLVADGTRRETLQHARDIRTGVEEIRHRIPFILVINKQDLTAEWEISEQDIEALEREGWSIIRSSARTGEGVEEAFHRLARLMV